MTNFLTGFMYIAPIVLIIWAFGFGIYRKWGIEGLYRCTELFVGLWVVAIICFLITITGTSINHG